MNFKKNEGFTLIELLVVIAIIGILSSVVLASLNTARDKGRDAAIKSSMQSIRVQSELFYDTNAFAYGVSAGCAAAGSMWVETTIAAAVAEIDTANGAGAVECSSSAQAWAMSSALPTGAFWCTDSTGVAREIAAITGPAVTVCPAA